MAKINDNILFQRDYRIDDHLSIYEYAQNNCQDIDAKASIAVLAKEGILYELNLTGAIIFESIMNNESEDNTIDKIVRLFRINPENATQSYKNFINNLSDKGILI